MAESLLLGKGVGDVVYERVFDAPKDVVWNAWSVPDFIMRWWGPQYYSSPMAKTDFKVGGKYLWAMRGPDGRTAWNAGVYKEIVPGERIVFTQFFSDDKGMKVPAKSYGLPGDWPTDVTVTISFKEQGGKTKLILKESGIPEVVRPMAQAGMNQSLDKLAVSLATMPRKGELFIERVFNAPRELVWRMWTVPEQMMRWWGPQGYSSPTTEIDFWVGGKYLSAMRSPEGDDIWSTGTYKEIVYLEKIRASDSFADSDGNIVEPTYYGEMFTGFPIEVEMTVVFEDLGGSTRMFLRHSGVLESVIEQTRMGWQQSFDKMEMIMSDDLKKTVLIAEPGKQEAIVFKTFDEPKELVFKAMTDPKLIPQWWGPEYLTTDIEKYEPRNGGSWRFVQKDPQGNTFPFHGVIHEFKAPEKIIRTFEWEGMPGHVLFETDTLQDVGGKTLATQKSVFQSVYDRDGMLESGMKDGAQIVMERMEKLLKKM